MSQVSLARRLLAPLIPVYQLALLLRSLRLGTTLEPVRRLHFPVVSIGNLSTGGSGKTPLTITLAKALTRRGLQVDVLSRGYGRQHEHVARVHPNGTAEEFGDEPLLIALETKLPVYVAAQRFDAGLLAEAEAPKLAPKPKPSVAKPEAPVAKPEAPADKPAEVAKSPEEPKPSPPPESVSSAKPSESADTETGKSGPEKEKSAEEAPPEEEKPAPPPIPVHLLDDGFQHRQLERTVDILLLDHEDWQEWLLPAGNLREPLRAAARATVIAIPANDSKLEKELRHWGWQGPVWRLRRKLEVPVIAGPVVAFCGIARPEQFFHGLEALGLCLSLRFAFPDHFRYTPLILEHMLDEARAAGAKTIITTEKDLVRLGKLALAFPSSLPLKTAHLSVEIEEEGTVLDWLIDRLTN
jgi:tetraacyldisaccharide-1-P 4'-kinase